LSARIGNGKAVTAAARKFAVLFRITPRYGIECMDRSAAYFEERYRQRVPADLT
jgi:hypothetical protein